MTPKRFVFRLQVKTIQSSTGGTFYSLQADPPLKRRAIIMRPAKSGTAAPETPTEVVMRNMLKDRESEYLFPVGQVYSGQIGFLFLFRNKLDVYCHKLILKPPNEPANKLFR